MNIHIYTNLGPEEAEYLMQDDLVTVIENLHVHIDIERKTCYICIYR